MNALALAASRADSVETLAPWDRPRPTLRLVTNTDPEPLRALDRPRTTSLHLAVARETQTVLVADADETVLSLLSFHLGSSFEVVRATDGEEALRLALVEEPDLIVLDVNMPKLNGYEVTRLVRRNPATREIPVILLDAHPQQIDTLRGFAAGADDYITKPLHPARLLSRVADVLDR